MKEKQDLQFVEAQLQVGQRSDISGDRVFDREGPVGTGTRLFELVKRFSREIARGRGETPSLWGTLVEKGAALPGVVQGDVFVETTSSVFGLLQVDGGWRVPERDPEVGHRRVLNGPHNFHVSNAEAVDVAVEFDA